MSTPGPSIQATLRGELGGFSLDIALQCPLQGITALFGPSGCGKTTVLRAMAGLQRMHGRLQVGDATWQDDSAAIFLQPHQRAVGYVFQEARLFPHLSVRRNLEYGWQRIGAAQRRVTFDDAVELLGLAGLLARRPHQLSGGQRQRAAIARALLTSPRLLLMDEPLSGLDRQSKNDILPYLERLHGELAMPVIYVSHAGDEVARLADHLVLMDAGRIRASGPLTELHARLDIAREAGSEADVVVQAQVAEHDDQYQLSYLQARGARFSVARADLPLGSNARLRILARDVSITLQHQSDTSILNIFPAVVQELTDAGIAQVLVRLDASGTPLLARITRKSASLLQLQPGKQVYAQVKAVALCS